MKYFWKAMIAVIIACVVMTGCHANKPQQQKKTANKPPTQTNKQNDFPLWGYDYQHTRHVPYKNITKDNVRKLGVVWQADLTDWDKSVPNAQQDFPVVQNGVMYVATASNYVFAIDAATGKKKWEWKPPKEVLDHIKASKWFSNVASRGVAVEGGNVYVLITDDRLAKLDANTGKLKKMVNFWDYFPEIKIENRHYETTAPMYYKGNIYVGQSGGDNGARGFVMAFRASDLKPAWKEPFWTVPARGSGWSKGKYTGGGSVWTPPAFDPDTDIMYFAVGNPAPDFFDKDRKGANPHTDSVVALDSKTGKFVWGGTEENHDIWDYDAAAPPMILNAKVGGKQRKIVVEGGKNGKWYAWDAKTGKAIYNGVPFVKIKHSTPPANDASAVPQWPGTEGGENYAPETYDPATNYVLIPGINKPSIAVAAKDNAEIAKNNDTFPGTKILPNPSNIKVSGNVVAIDVNTGKKVYEVKTDDEMRGGLTSTDSGLAFYGRLDGSLNALDIKSGKLLWHMKSGGAQIKMAPVIYMAGGKEYITIISDGTKVVTYGLGGKPPSKMPQGKAKLGKTETSNVGADPAQIYKGSCASCHGANLEGGVGPALNHIGKSMSKQDLLNQIKNGSGRMPGGLIKGQQAQAVADWLAKKK
ncbi:PQQ-binding-like beta-propeller repeat protein [Camelliibacillus cellulosilyticus]|uniref:PQQ-binding-like beta-propeller repeat protein n=1 Tax=Camelliibacillus cellulosilyticus TaxID=2174486 RepID=A0ABV9GMY8_9BACL